MRPGYGMPPSTGTPPLAALSPGGANIEARYGMHSRNSGHALAGHAPPMGGHGLMSGHHGLAGVSPGHGHPSPSGLGGVAAVKDSFLAQAAREMSAKGMTRSHMHGSSPYGGSAPSISKRSTSHSLSGGFGAFDYGAPPLFGADGSLPPLPPPGHNLAGGSPPMRGHGLAGHQAGHGLPPLPSSNLPDVIAQQSRLESAARRPPVSHSAVPGPHESPASADSASPADQVSMRRHLSSPGSADNLAQGQSPQREAPTGYENTPSWRNASPQRGAENPQYPGSSGLHGAALGADDRLASQMAAKDESMCHRIRAAKRRQHFNRLMIDRTFNFYAFQTFFERNLKMFNIQKCLKF